MIVRDMFLAVALYSCIDKKKKGKKERIKKKGGGEREEEENKKRIELHLLFLICRLGDRRS